MLDRSVLKSTAKLRMRAPFFKLIGYTLFYLVAATVVSFIVQFSSADVALNSNAGLSDAIGYYTAGAGSFKMPLLASAVMLVYNLFVSIIQMGYKRVCLMVARGEDVSFGDMFDPFGYWLKVIVIHFVRGLLIGLGTLCFVVPGIILTYEYSQVDFVLLDNPDIGVFEALRKSRDMMRGHKFECFVFGLSYILWYLLGSMFIVAYLYVVPYVAVGEALYYEYVAGNQTFVRRPAFTGDSNFRQDESDNGDNG